MVKAGGWRLAGRGQSGGKLGTAIIASMIKKKREWSARFGSTYTKKREWIILKRNLLE